MITFDPAVTFGAGAIVGALSMRVIDNILARQRTTEDRNIRYHNEAADQLNIILRKERDFPTPESKIDFEPFRRVLKSISKRKLRCFDKAVEEYEKAKEEQKHNINSILDFCSPGEEGRFNKPSYLYHDSSSIKTALDKLLEFTERA
ncbi:MAG TPA: hypothetical protein VN642_15615 [Dongiaceae bacterium]|nr:hypothetical protein [Dongiaceae bacterium]